MSWGVPRTACLIIVALIGIATVHIAAQDRAEREILMSESFRAAVERLDARKDTPQVGTLFIDALRTADSIAAVELLIDEYYGAIESDSERSAAATEIAAVYELSHRYEEARRFYGEALRLDDSNDEVAIRVARVLIEIGNVSEALIPLDRVMAAPDSRDTQRWAAVIRGRALFLLGETEKALLHARSLSGMNTPYDSENPPLVEIEAYTLLLDMAQQLDQRELFLEGYSRMERSFPDSPVLEMYRSYLGETADVEYRVTSYPSPSRLIRGNQPLEAPVIASSTDSTGSSMDSLTDTSEPTVTARVVGIQTGSFRDRENAEYMALDIEELGFDATITETTISGDTFFRVLVDVPDGAVDAVQSYVVRLKERGIEGFLVFDE